MVVWHKLKFQQISSSLGLQDTKCVCLLKIISWVDTSTVIRVGMAYMTLTLLLHITRCLLLITNRKYYLLQCSGNLQKNYYYHFIDYISNIFSSAVKVAIIMEIIV